MSAALSSRPKDPKLRAPTAVPGEPGRLRGQKLMIRHPRIAGFEMTPNPKLPLFFQLLDHIRLGALRLQPQRIPAKIDLIGAVRLFREMELRAKARQRIIEILCLGEVESKPVGHITRCGSAKEVCKSYCAAYLLCRVLARRPPIYLICLATRSAASRI